jgi:2-haloacid dehalogenase
MTRAVIFDVGHVLIDWNPRHLYSKMLASEAEIEAFLEEIGFDEWNRALDAGGLWADAIAQAVARHPHRRDLIEAAHIRWHEMVPGAIDGTVAILELLAAQGVPLYAITNYSAEKFVETRARFPFFSHFRDIVVSADEGLMKPDAAIYRLCLQRNGLDASACVFIDDVPANVAGAAAVGIDAILFESPGQLARDLAARNILPAVTGGA